MARTHCLAGRPAPLVALISILYVVAGWAGEASAQDAAAPQREARQALAAMLGTTSVEARPDFVDGRLRGCLLLFSALAQDHVYKQGNYISISGSFGLVGGKGKPLAVSLKVVLHDLNPVTMALTPSPPATAYFVSGYTTTKDEVVLSEKSDTPGALFAIFKAEQTFKVLAEGLARDKVIIAFTRNLGGTDIQVPIDTSVVATSAKGQRTRSPNATMEFSKCADQLAAKSSPTTRTQHRSALKSPGDWVDLSRSRSIAGAEHRKVIDHSIAGADHIAGTER